MKSRTVRMTPELIAKIKTRSKPGERTIEVVLRRLLQMPPKISGRPSVFESVGEEE